MGLGPCFGRDLWYLMAAHARQADKHVFEVNVGIDALTLRERDG